MSSIEMYEGHSGRGVALKAAYGEDASADVAFALLFVADELPRLVYWGRPLTHPQSVLSLYDALCPQRVSGALDQTAWPTVLPTQAEAWTGAKRFVVRRGGVELFCKFGVTGVDVRRDAPRIIVEAADRGQDVGLTWICELTKGGLIRQRAIVRNLAQSGMSQGPTDFELPDGRQVGRTSVDASYLEVDKVELGFALPACATELLTTTGHHLRERSPQRQPFNVGRVERASMSGRPDFDASLLLTAGVPGFGFEHGEAYSVHVGWSGNSLLSAERLPYTQGVIGGGEVLMGGEVTLAPGASDGSAAAGEVADEDDGCCAAQYATPWVYGAYGDGLNEISHRFHAYLRGLHPAFARKPRPVILNTWEAVYFDQNYGTLAALADTAARIGVERFVVDDGWFGSRRDDTSGLGDWQIAQEIWPDGPKGLRALADHVHGKGMEFGLWFEPEMVNPDSRTAHEHPDWLLAPAPGRLPMQGRSQQTVDLTNPEAYEYVFGALDGLVGGLGIDYIKWDHNRFVLEAVSPRTGRPAVHAQTLAVYRMFRNLKRNHPGLEIESCASGGGRVDLGILRYADRIWGSDCVDPVERADIQRYTSLLVPPEMIGEHVGASPAHSTGRATSLQMRMAMAFFGHFGVEWNLLERPQGEMEKLGVWIDAYKRYRGQFTRGYVVHGDEGDRAVRLDGVVGADGTVAVYRFTQLSTSQTYPAAPVRLPGLDPDAVYRVHPLSVDSDLQDGRRSNGQSELNWWNESGVMVSGRALTSYGLRPPALNPAQAVLFVAERA